jgi:hypothetical protein
MLGTVLGSCCMLGFYQSKKLAFYQPGGGGASMEAKTWAKVMQWEEWVQILALAVWPQISYFPTWNFSPK